MSLRWLDPRRFGRRGAFLLLFGAMWTISGYSRMNTEPSDDQLAGLRVLFEVAPYRSWVTLWFIAGLLAIAAAFLRKPGWDTFGYVALIIPVTLWCFSNAAMYLFFDYRYGMTAASTLACLIVALLIVCGWPESRW